MMLGLSAAVFGTSMVLAVVLWALVLIPLLWGVYQTLTGVFS